MDSQTRGRLLPLTLALVVAACTSSSGGGPEPVRAVQPQQELAAETVLDVGIRVFDPGLPAENESEHEEEGIFPEVRRSEARYVPVKLAGTLQETGQWGAVRVLPTAPETMVDVLVTGQILVSTGMKLEVAIEARDAKGRIWLEKTYEEEADVLTYAEGVEGREPPFQDLYDRIANDLLKARARLDGPELLEIRQLSHLRFASQVVPEVFGDYLGEDRRGLYEAVRLPAREDPMVQRVTEIRSRDDLFVDTLNEYYNNFAVRMGEHYDDWRAFSYEEELARQELIRASRWKKVLGGLAIVGAILAPGGGSYSSVARDAAVLGGLAAIRSGIANAQEAKMHQEAIKELAASFDAEMEPLLVEVEGETMRLTGSAEAQYAAWRKLLRRIFEEETGLPVDPDTSAKGSQRP